jgi:FixJ family two-component response regulator
VLADAIRRVAEGECVLDPTIVARLIRRPRHGEPLDELTDREREVLALVAEGRSNHAIAELLVLSQWNQPHHKAAVATLTGALLALTTASAAYASLPHGGGPAPAPARLWPIVIGGMPMPLQDGEPHHR